MNSHSHTECSTIQARAHNSSTTTRRRYLISDDMDKPFPPPEAYYDPSIQGWLNNERRLNELQMRLRIQGHVIVLLKYLEDNDPKMLLLVVKMMQPYRRLLPKKEIVRRFHNEALEPMHLPNNELMGCIRKVIGEAHWTVFLEYYRQFCRNRGVRTKIQVMESDCTIPPPFPTLSAKLDEHVTAAIFGFLDGKDMYEASKVSIGFRDALIPRQKNVTIAGFSSFESFREMNFVGMEYFTASESPLMTDYVASVIANDYESYPYLSRACLTFCRNLTCTGETTFVEAMGPRLEKFIGAKWSIAE